MSFQTHYELMILAQIIKFKIFIFDPAGLRQLNRVRPKVPFNAGIG